MPSENPEVFETQLDASIVTHMSIIDIDSVKNITEYVVKVSPFVKKEVLLEFKDFLLSEPKGDVKVWLDFKGQKIDTQVSISNLDKVKMWVEERMGDER